MDLRNRVKLLLKMCGHAFLSTLHDRFDVLERQTQNASFPETQAALLQASIHTVEKLHQLTDHVIVETNDDRQNPEIELMEFLYSYLPTRKAMVASANGNGVRESLRSVGYEVSENGTDIPSDVGLTVVDASANPLTAPSSPVVMMGYRDTPEAAVREMRSRGYQWHIVLHRIPGEGKAAFYANYARLVPDSSGSIFFFRDYATFAQAQSWCSAVLPRTYFKSRAANSRNSTTESIPRE